MKRQIITLILFIATIPAGAQTLFSYGTHKVSREEFLAAFHKNNPDTGDYRKQVSDYLDLYTRFRLKVQWAYDAKLDTLPNQRSDAASFRQQIESTYLTDTTLFAQMARQAWERSLKDIRLSHIFIPFRKPGEPAAPVSRQDSLAAGATLKLVMDGLKAGQSFEQLALQYSGDPQVQQHKGYLGYVTVFTLPYAMENVVYGLADQAVSEPVLSPAGWHVFKKLGERAAAGKVEVAQILLAADPGAGPESREKTARLADSLYRAIAAGSAFDSLAIQFSNDKSSAATGGRIPPFGVGVFDPVFEAQAFALGAPGSVSRPFETSYGFHILRKVGQQPVERDPSIGTGMYKALVQEDKRSQLAAEAFGQSVLQKTRYRKNTYSPADLWRITDTMLVAGKAISSGTLNENSPIFQVGNTPVTVADWLAYSRENNTGAGRASYPAMMESFVRYRATDYYRAHLEEYDPAFARQMREFRDGNLLFEAMERQVWSKAAADTAGLRAYYLAHRNKYQWAPSVDAITVHANSLATAKEAVEFIKKQPTSWATMVEQSGGRIMADSGRFETQQLPKAPGVQYTPGTLTPLISNDADGTQSFVYVVKAYPNPAPRSFDEARGLVMTDYQQALEDQWIAQLKKKYPVKVNAAEWQKVLQKP